MISLNQAIHQKTDQLFWGTRFFKATEAICTYNKWSKLSAFGLLAGSAAASAYMIAFSYFCMEGVVRSYGELQERGDSLIGLRPLGDAGGWTMMSIFSALTIEKLYWNIIYTGESLRLKNIVDDWQNQNKIDSPLKQQVQQHFNALSDAYNSKCLFQLRVIDRYSVALATFSNKISKEDISEFENTLQKMREKIARKTSTKRYLQRCWAGIASANEQAGYVQKIRTLIRGGALPVILTGMIAISCVGEYGLGLELFRDRNDLVATGHFGEWLLNVAEAAAVSYFLHRWSLVNEGDYVIIQRIYHKFLNAIPSDSPEYQCLSQLAKEELTQAAAICDYVKLPQEEHTLLEVHVEGNL